ncbi:TetR/AcrR family transcriptional regulator [soil metagenome]
MRPLVDTRPTRRERQREATFTEIVNASRELLAEGAELSLRAVASRMGMTAPALYRYVANYQDLVDLVAYEIDKAATETFAAAAEAIDADHPAGRLIAAVTEFRQWALANPREFALVFANPVAEVGCASGQLLTAASSGLLMTDLMLEVYLADPFPVPELADLAPAVRESLLEPLIPAKIERVPDGARGLVWVYMQGWTQLYGVVVLEVMGHMDPRVIESGEMFIDVIRRFAPVMGLTDDVARLEEIIRTRLAA